MKIILVRHGATAMNGEENKSADRIRAWLDVPLTAQGRKEAEDSAAQVKTTGIQALVSSDLKRAHQTADIIGKKVGLKVDVNKKLRPWDLGDFTGKGSKEALPKIKEYVEKHPDRPVPNGESFNSFRDRAFAGLKEINEKYYGQLVGVVTHHRVERLLHAWKAKGEPKDRSIDVNEFLQKGAAPAAIQRMKINEGSL